MSSLRKRLRIKTFAVVAIFCVFFAVQYWASRRLDETLARVHSEEVVAEYYLRDILAAAGRIRTSMLGVLLAEQDAVFAMYDLQDQRRLIIERWASFMAEHAKRPDDVRGRLLAELVGDELPSLMETLGAIEAAYRIYDPVDLTRISRQAWPQLERNVLRHLEALTELQRGHAQEAYAGLRQEFADLLGLSRWLLGGGVLLVLGLSLLLNRHINRQIGTIERALERIAAGNLNAQVPGDRSTEFGRISQAINATIGTLRKDRAEIEALGSKTEAILACMTDGLYGVDGEGRIVFINAAALRMLGYQEHELLGRNAHQALHHRRPDGQPYPLEACRFAAARVRQETLSGDDEFLVRSDGGCFPVEYVCAPLRGGSFASAAIVVFRDITERRTKAQALEDAYGRLKTQNDALKSTQSQLLQSEKMASIGQLAAGVAHEINNPVGFVNSNLGTLRLYVEQLIALVDAYGALELHAGAQDAACRATLEAARDQADLVYLREDVFDLLDESQDGLARIRRIVADLKDFSHVGEIEWQDADINAGLESTLNVVWNELKYKAEVVREFGALPRVRCLAAQLNQVFMNLLVNAAQAIEERGEIRIRTWARDAQVCVEISDTGKGMSEEVRQRIFEPFFTTKPVGKGTGLGLSIAWDIVRKHGGEFEVDSAPGQGARFTIRLPVTGPATSEANKVAA